MQHPESTNDLSADDVFFYVGAPYFDECADDDSWQTVRVYPLHFFTGEVCRFSVLYAHDVHRNEFAYLQPADDRSLPFLERLFSYVLSRATDAAMPVSRRESELFETVSDLLDRAEQCIEADSLHAGCVVSAAVDQSA
jgi:hypothetical protein